MGANHDDVIKVDWRGDLLCTAIFLSQVFYLLYFAYCLQTQDGGQPFANGPFQFLVVGTFAMFFAINVCKYVGATFAKYVSKHYVKNDPMSKPILLRKFSDQSWQLVVHVSMTIFELIILERNQFHWVEDPDQSWIPAPWRQERDPLIQKFYLSQLCIWVATGISHKFLEEKHKDYTVMYIHHIATLGLVFGSWTVNYTRIGVLVLFTHDASDIFIDLLKLTNNLKLHERQWFYCCEICFVLVLLSWAIARGWYLATKIIPSTALGCVRKILDDDMKYEDFTNKYKGYDFIDQQTDVDKLSYYQLLLVGSGSYALHPAMNVLLVAILCMNIYWYCILLKILVGKCKGESSDSIGKRAYEGTDGQSSKVLKQE